MTIGEFFNNLALKAGIASDNDELKALLSAPELTTVKIPDALVTSMDENLLSLESAKKNHPVLKKHYAAAAYDGMDQKLKDILGSDTFTQQDIDEINAQPLTTAKYAMAIQKLKEAKATAKGADKDAINKEIADAHLAAKTAKDEVVAVRNEYEGKIKNIKKQTVLQTLYAQYKTMFDDLPGNAKNTAIESLINNALQDKNAELSVDENGNLVLVGKDGSNVFGSNHVQLTPKSFLDQTIAPILKVSGPPKPVVPMPQAPANPAHKDVDISNISSHNAQVIADMAAPKPSLM